MLFKEHYDYINFYIEENQKFGFDATELYQSLKYTFNLPDKFINKRTIRKILVRDFGFS